MKLVWFLQYAEAREPRLGVNDAMNLGKFNSPQDPACAGRCEVGGMQARGADRHAMPDPDTFRLALVHELRAPLQVLQGHLEALRAEASVPVAAECGGRTADGVDDGGRLRRSRLNAMGSMLRVAAGVVDDVLHLKCFGDGGADLPLQASEFEIRACLDEEIHAFGEIARLKGLALECDIADDVPLWGTGDAVRLRQIVRTLVDNALKFTVCGGVAATVSWRADAPEAQGVLDGPLGKDGTGSAGSAGRTAGSPQSGWLTVRVSDTGPGIPAGMENTVFAAFSRVDQAVPGTGLGLWIARQWAHRMGGALCVEPSTTGARFRLSLPLATPCMSPLRRSMPTPVDMALAPVNVRPGLHVLVVDDHVMNRAVLADQLASLGCRVERAQDLTQALLQWVSHEIDVVLTDVQLGGACGLTLAKTLQALAPVLGRRPPVVFAVTGSIIAARAAREAGIDAVLTKPVSRAKLGRVLALRWPCETGEWSSSPIPVASPAVRRSPLSEDPCARRLMRDEMAKDLARFRRLMGRRRREDLDAAQALLHRMRGACRMFGDPALTARCDRLSAKLADCRRLSVDGGGQR
ncbi:Sensory/regulatory protein RpfC [Pandoraea morbifera]|uniref:histidine kinase n=1 Tax=Pandoraea morbifera TaxID=2508300 RepID=A0A5E4RUN1_9BURK|nr:ATP-binding protein [Pandoraea morbifera]VVD67176.1 Sensory/regulatory protein RpfC [Pandoraea morbifera]